MPHSRLTERGWDDTLKVWDAHRGTVLHTLTGHTGGPKMGCAFSPDGRWVASVRSDVSSVASDVASVRSDETLRVWDAHSGRPTAHVELQSVFLECVSWHPWQPQVACGDDTGGLCRVEVMGIEHRPIVVTATKRRRKLAVRCPACQSDHPLERSGLGSDLTCPTEGCGLDLHVNTFVL